MSSIIIHDTVIALSVLLAAIWLRRVMGGYMESAKREAAIYRLIEFAAIGGVVASTLSYCQIVRSTVVTYKMLAAWKREQAGEKLPEDHAGSSADPVTGGDRAGRVELKIHDS